MLTKLEQNTADLQTILETVKNLEVGGVSKLPEGYTQLEYIESTGTQYIDTGYKAASENYRIKCKFAVTSAASNAVLFGGGASTDIISAMMTAESQLKFYVGSGSVSGALTPFATNTEYEMECFANNGNLTVTLDGASRSGAYSGVVNKDYPLFVFASNASGSASQFSSIKIYWFQIYDNGKLVRDFIPCIDNNGKSGLYDAVSGVFYGNDGNGDFGNSFSSNPELLWTNASPSSTFADQSVTLPSGYAGYIVEGKFLTSTDGYLCKTYIPVGSTTPCFASTGVANNGISIRLATASTTGIAFQQGHMNGSVNNGVCIPTYIWGVKFTL